MSNTEKFEYCLKSGTIGEDIAFNYLRHRPDIKQVIDVSQDKQRFQLYDVDLLFITNDNQCYWVEVKRDTKTDETGNICYELTSNGNSGCLARSNADIIFYISKRFIYIFSLKNVREYINKTNPKEIAMGDGATGYLLKAQDLVDKKIARKVEYVGN